MRSYLVNVKLTCNFYLRGDTVQRPQVLAYQRYLSYVTNGHIHFSTRIIEAIYAELLCLLGA